MNIDTLLSDMWQQYISHNQQAEKIHSLLLDEGENIVNDHIALRTFNHPSINIDVLGDFFIEFGYEEKEDYHFEEKKLSAKHYRHPTKDVPLIFISELKCEEFSNDFQKTIDQLIEAIPNKAINNPKFLTSGIHWPMISKTTYDVLLKESEYAAWLATFGFRANHFTVTVNKLKNYNLLELNAFLKKNGFKLNTSGGEIKGSASVYLEQSSTLAEPINIEFSDGKAKVPCCYYEFAQRHMLPSGEIFTGFISKSADKIFESTNKK